MRHRCTYLFAAVLTALLIVAPLSTSADEGAAVDEEVSAHEATSTNEGAGVDADDVWPPMPGAAIKAGAGLYRSVPCGCVDRGLANVEFSGRLHFGNRGAIEADIQRGTMLLGGNFPSQGWSVGGRVTLRPQHGRWWENLSARAGFRRWQTMGMRADGTRGFFTAINWAVEVAPHIFLEGDIIGGRTFVDMQHWNLGARFGVATRF